MNTPELTEARKKHPESLRLALSMRGGVSLAVWIGGGVAEIESLRKASTSPAPDPPVGNAGVYQRLLALANYGAGVEVDILTGASAGGLNGAIYAASLVYGFDFEDMADIWLELADVESLSRPTTWRESSQAPSLFDGDGYFLAQCEQKLGVLVERQTKLHQDQGRPLHAQVSRLDLFLSATRRVAEQKVLRNDAFNDIHESRSSAFFHFRHLGDLDSPLSDFGADPSDPTSFSDSLSRLARSGRASSSFPVAFEPAKITSRDDQPRSATNLFGIFSEAGTDVEVIDGGVLDNIPVAMAIEAIAAAPAQSPTSRWLLYLHPSPPTVDDTGDTDGQASEFIGIVRDLKTTLTLKFNNESLIDDMVELDRHNQRVRERRATRIGLLETARRAGLPLDAAYKAWGASDARQIAQVLADPQLATSTHPFVRVHYGELPQAWTSIKRTALETNLAEDITQHYREAGDKDNDALPLIAMGDTVEVLLGIAQQVVVEGGEAQRPLYRIRLLVEVLNTIWEQSWLEAAHNDPPGDDPKQVKTWIRDTAFGCMVRTEVLTHDLVDALVASPPDEVDRYHRALREHYDARVVGPLEPDDSLPPLSDLWQYIEPIARMLVDASGSLEDPIVVVLREALRDDSLGLSWFARVCAPLQRRHMVGESEISFLRVAGSNRSPLSELFLGQLDQGVLTVENKLAGNQVANFGAFFSAQWRANDWMWGRLDTAKSLVDLLADSQRWFTASNLTPNQVLEALDEIVVAPFAEPAADEHTGADQTTWHDWLQQQWEARRASVLQELQDAHAAAQSTVSYPLLKTKHVLVARLQAELLSRHIEWVADTGEEPPTNARDRVPSGYTATRGQAAALTSGVDKLPGSLDTRRWARIGMRLGFNAWNAVVPTGWLRYPLMAIKPVVLFIMGILAFPRRALFAGLIGFGVLAVGRWEQPTDLVESEWLSWPTAENDVTNYVTWQRLSATVVAGLLAALACYLQFNRELPAKIPARTVQAILATVATGLLGAGTIALIIEPRIGIGLVGAAAVLGAVVARAAWAHRETKAQESWAWRGWILVALAGLLGGAMIAMNAFRASLVPISVPITAVFVVAVGMNWIPVGYRVVIAAIAVASYLGTWLLFMVLFDLISWGWWALLSFALAINAVTAFVSRFDVFPDPTTPSR